MLALPPDDLLGKLTRASAGSGEKGQHIEAAFKAKVLTLAPMYRTELLPRA
jgi:hypothetical protein